METKIIMSNVKEKLELAKKKASVIKHADILETTWKWPNELGRGTIKEIQINKGISIIFTDRRLNNNLIFMSQTSPPALFFCFCIRGVSTASLSKLKWDIGSRPGKCDLLYAPDEVPVVEEPSGQRVSFVIIKVLPSFINSLLNGHMDEFPKELKWIVNESKQTLYYRSGVMNDSMHMAATQMLGCPYQGIMKQVYLESKIQELIILFLAHFVVGQKHASNSLALSSTHVQRIYEARDILIYNMESPPTLTELAKKIGVCPTKLKTGFREVFGTTVFDYLKKQRLNLAKQLLAEEGKSPTEAAFEVGYASIPSFYRAFVKEFGATPGSFRSSLKCLSG